MPKKQNSPGTNQAPEPITINDSIKAYFGEQIPITCSLKEAADITGLSYDSLLAASKCTVRGRRLPGFKPSKSHYRVLVSGLPGWIERMCAR